MRRGWVFIEGWVGWGWAEILGGRRVFFFFGIKEKVSLVVMGYNNDIVWFR